MSKHRHAHILVALLAGQAGSPAFGESNPLMRCGTHSPAAETLNEYGDEKQAMQGYARLPKEPINASACLTCDAPCAGACPEGVPIRRERRASYPHHASGDYAHFDAVELHWDTLPGGEDEPGDGAWDVDAGVQTPSAS